MQAHDGLFKISETIHRSRMTQSARSTGLRQETENEIGLIDPTPFFFFSVMQTLGPVPSAETKCSHTRAKQAPLKHNVEGYCNT